MYLKIPNNIPIEIVNKILLYSHNILDRKVQNDIINYSFEKKIKSKNIKYCSICLKYHRIPKHFRC